jgi:ParB/RepB/Spo0J family partition protein
MKRRHAEVTIGEESVDDEDDEAVVGRAAQGAGDEGVPRTPDGGDSIYIGGDSVDLDSEIPRRYTEMLDARLAKGADAPLNEDELRTTRRGLSRLVHGGENRAVEGVQPPTPDPARRLDARRGRLRADHEDRRDGHTKSMSREVVDLPVASITGSLVENVRLQEDEEAFRALCGGLSREGQLHPIVVIADRHRSGRYQTVAGSRRLRAAAELGWPTIRATICAAGTSEEELYFLNATENALRFKLSTFEVASRAQLMSSRFGTSHADYARRLGLSAARVQNLVRYLERLPLDILDAWRNGDPFMNDHILQRLAAMPHDEASEFWAEWRAARVRESNGPKRGRFGPRRSEDRPTSVMVNRLWVAAKRSPELDEKTRELVLKVVEFCLGHTPTVPGLFDPKRSPVGKKSSS